MGSCTICTSQTETKSDRKNIRVNANMIGENNEGRSKLEIDINYTREDNQKK